MGGRVAEGAPLLREYMVLSRIVGSNPTPSAIFLAETVSLQDGCRRKSQLLRRFQDEAVDLASGLVSQNLSLPANSLWNC